MSSANKSSKPSTATPAPDPGSGPAPGGADDGADGPRPRRLTAAAVLTGLEGVVVAVSGVVSLVLVATGHAEETMQAAALSVTVLVLSLLPLASARGLWRRRRWSRGPSMIVQLIALPVGWQLLHGGGGQTVAGVCLGVVGLAVLACLVNPTAARALGIGPDVDGA